MCRPKRTARFPWSKMSDIEGLGQPECRQENRRALVGRRSSPGQLIRTFLKNWSLGNRPVSLA